jgi:hypothetical protein
MASGVNPVSNNEIKDDMQSLNNENNVEKKINETAQQKIEENGEQSKKAEEPKSDKPVEDLSKKAAPATEQTAKKVGFCDCIKRFFGFSK